MFQRFSSWLASALPDLYAPQPTLADGPYSRFSCDEGSFVVILSAVWGAKHHPHLCHVSFSPRQSASAEVKRLRFLTDNYPDRMETKRRREDNKGRVAAWTLTAGEGDAFRYDVDADQQVFALRFPALDRNLKLDIRCTDNRPYSALGPLGLARILGPLLPTKWHVFSTRSKAQIKLSDDDTGAILLQTSGLAHQEKNMGDTFPTAWIWAQAFSPISTASLVLAGGNVAPGIRSLFCGMRSPAGRAWNFGPAGTVQVLGYGPGISVDQDSRQGRIALVLTDGLRGRRLRINGHAPPDTFVSMAAPMPEGHRDGYCYESFDTTYKLQLEERRWSLLWPRFETVESYEMEDGACLEFGGSWSHFGKDT